MKKRKDWLIKCNLVVSLY